MERAHDPESSQGTAAGRPRPGVAAVATLPPNLNLCDAAGLSRAVVGPGRVWWRDPAAAPGGQWRSRAGFIYVTSEIWRGRPVLVPMFRAAQREGNIERIRDRRLAEYDGFTQP